jgi:hypothetical protein
MQNTPKPNLKKAFEKAMDMQDPEYAGYHRLVGAEKKYQQRRSSVINYRRDKFHEELVPESISLINNFMDDMGVNINDTVFAGSDNSNVHYTKNNERYINSSTTRLIPNRHADINFANPNFAAQIRSYNTRYRGDKVDGIKYLENEGGAMISVRESEFGRGIEHLTHEQFHQVVFGEQVHRNNLFGEEGNTELNRKLEHTIVEGTVELFKQITFIRNDKYDFNKTYINEVSLMVHLLENVSEILGRPGYPNYKLALKYMIVWSYKGGTNSRFVNLCKKIKTRYFPKGFDIYSVDSDQVKRQEQLLADNIYDFKKVKAIAKGTE